MTPKKLPATVPASEETDRGVPDRGLPEWVPPEAVTVALADLADAAREACWPWPSAPDWGDAGADGRRRLGRGRAQGKWNPDRIATRHGSDDGEVTLGGRRVPIRRTRDRSADGTTEVAVPTYELLSSTEILGRMAMERMLAKLSARRYRVGLEPVGTAVEAEARSTRSRGVPPLRGHHRAGPGGAARRRPVGPRPGGGSAGRIPAPGLW